MAGTGVSTLLAAECLGLRRAPRLTSRYQPGRGTHFSREVIAFFATHLVPVRVPISSQPLPKQFKVQWTPTLVTLDETGEEHHRTVGFLSPEELVPSLMLGIGKSYFDREMFAESEKMLKQLLAEYPRSDAAPEATYYLGVGR